MHMKDRHWETALPAVPPLVHARLERALEEKTKMKQTTKKVMRPLTAAALAVALLLALTGAAYAVAQLGILDYLIGRQSPTPALEEMAQPMAVSETFDQIQLTVTGAMYDGVRLALSFSAENLNPARLAMVNLKAVRLNGDDVFFGFQSLSQQWLPDVFAMDEAGKYSRNPVTGGMLSVPLAQDYSGSVACEVDFSISRPANGKVLVCDPVLWYDYERAFADAPSMIPDYQERRDAIIQSGLTVLDAFESLQPDHYSFYLAQGYTLLDASGQFLLDDDACQALLADFRPEAWGEQASFNEPPDRSGQMTEPQTYTLSFSLDMDAAESKRIVCEGEDILLPDCRVHFTQAVLSPLSTVIAYEIMPNDPTQAAAQTLARRYGMVSLTDEEGKPLNFYNMEEETNWGLNSETGPLFVEMMLPGLQTIPQEIHFRFDENDADADPETLSWRKAFEENVVLRVNP